jgi:hypothetical protein
MVEKSAERLKKETASEGVPTRTGISFSRRMIREYTGWSNTRLHIHLKELVELEYVLVESGRNGMQFRYRLAYEGQGRNGGRFMLGLLDPRSLAGSNTYDMSPGGYTFQRLSPTFHPPFTHLSDPENGVKALKTG